MPPRRRAREKQLSFGHKLILNQWIVSLFGYNPLYTDGYRVIFTNPIKPLVDAIQYSPEGMTDKNRHQYLDSLVGRLDFKKADFTREQLSRYEDNIACHTQNINEGRHRPIAWKYFQWLSLLFTEIYLDRYFADRELLRERLNRYVTTFNSIWKGRGYETVIETYKKDDLNKICLQNATGSGKTLLMHVNFLQFRHYANASAWRHDLVRTILITPNEGLSEQHRKEMRASGIKAERLRMDKDLFFSSGKSTLRQVDFTEVTKLGNQDGPNIIAVRNLGDQNLLLVDEAHRGMSSQEERGWFSRRKRLSEKGFVFEYSATFREAVAAAKSPEIEADYAKSILFDYSYRYFYGDGYGKDYRIFNMPATYEQQNFAYLVACLLSFYQQLKLHADKKNEYAPYNIEKPLWVFVGSSVTKAKNKGKSEKETISDVGKIIRFLADFLYDTDGAAAEINRLLAGNPRDTGFLDENEQDVFAGNFEYLRHLLDTEKWSMDALRKDILRLLFQTESEGSLHITRIKGDENEILLRVGEASTPFGLINVGDAAALTSHIASKDMDYVTVEKSEFSDPLFAQITSSASPINLLIGSKRFVEGWDCWRVSTLGLMHVGKSEGTQIIQLFGRGVRLKGYDWSLQRSGYATPPSGPEYIHYLETLNVFGIEANFMQRFRDFLREEGLPDNEKKAMHTIKLEHSYDYDQRLKILRQRRRKDGSSEEYDFGRDGAVPCFGQIPQQWPANCITIDLYPHIQSMQSQEQQQSETRKEIASFKEKHWAFLDYDDLFLRLEKFKRMRGWHNLNIDKASIRALLSDDKWYRLTVPPDRMGFTRFSNVHLWQETAGELLQKYAEKYYNHCKASFLEPRLEVREIQKGDGTLPDTDEYRIFVDADDRTIIRQIETLKTRIKNNQTGILEEGGLKACVFGNHLYRPILHAGKDSKIQILPFSLNESEFQFLKDLRWYIESEQERPNSEGAEFFLLRNENRKHGIGFFEAENFHPDFLFWQIRDGKQYLSFIDPHGLQHTGVGDEKIQFYKTIKNIQNRLRDRQIILNSFIVSPTPHANLNWSESMQELNNKHVLFMQEQSNTYIATIIHEMLK